MPKRNVIFYTVDTTGGDHKMDSILHIGAVSCCGVEFDRFVRPAGPLNEHASEENGFSVGSDGRTLYKWDRRVKTVCLTRALQDFREFLEGRQVDCYLVANSFHHRFISQALMRTKLKERFRQSVMGFTDSLPLFREELGSKRNNFKLRALAGDLLNRYNLRDAIDKAEATRELFEYLQIPWSTIRDERRWYWDD